MSDSTFMKKALLLAEQAGRQNEVPVGAVLVYNSEIVASSSNSREISQNPLNHAEADAIQRAASALKTWRLNESTLYVTMEPCLMCTGLIYASRISRVVFGCKNPKGGSLSYIEERRKELNLNHSVEILGGILEKECAALLQAFFQSRRKSKN